MRLSVIIPAINEQAFIASAVWSAIQAGATEVIAVDGGSSDDSVDEARQAGATVVTASPGRAKQMNHGAGLSTGTVVLFLHADCRLPPDAAGNIKLALAAGFTWGYFRQRIDSPGLKFRLLEFGNGMRAKYLRCVFGDQALWVTRESFLSAGGFPEMPLMEDVAISRQLRKSSPPARINLPLYVSPRRWQQHGVIRQTLRNWTIQLRYLLGAKPVDLARSYRRHDSQPDPDQ